MVLTIEMAVTCDLRYAGTVTVASSNSAFCILHSSFCILHFAFMPLIIDGYNLLNATGIAGRGRGPGRLEQARQALLNTLVESLPVDEVAKTTVVFDASESPWGVQRQLNHRGISVYFAAKDDDADSVIERLIAADSAPKRLTVVSSDHRLQRAAKRRKAAERRRNPWPASPQNPKDHSHPAKSTAGSENLVCNNLPITSQCVRKMLKTHVEQSVQLKRWVMLRLSPGAREGFL
jgi:predicted RNA-binding protein with PIN domain